MGMFDHIIVNYPLPDGAPGEGWQTKSLECFLRTFKIRADGILMMKANGGEFKHDWRYLWSGELRFYTDTRERLWWEFAAVFEDGKLQHLRTVRAGVSMRDALGVGR